jgi:hypothetical protein
MSVRTNRYGVIDSDKIWKYRKVFTKHIQPTHIKYWYVEQWKNIALIGNKYYYVINTFKYRVKGSDTWYQAKNCKDFIYNVLLKDSEASQVKWDVIGNA